jgi:hypothetical protein
MNQREWRRVRRERRGEREEGGEGGGDEDSKPIFINGVTILFGEFRQLAGKVWRRWDGYARWGGESEWVNRLRD